MTDIGWGHLVQFEAYGRVGDVEDDFKIIPYEESKGPTYSSFMHASHAMLFARNDAILWNLYSAKAAVLMQMRFDGLLGFPGGLVDPGEDPLAAANRELLEEIGFDINKHKLEETNHVVSFVNKNKNLVLHFYGKEFTMDEFRTIELNNLAAPDYGDETLGIIRVPLFTMGDGYRGFPAYLSNSYAGNSRQELLIGLQHFNILSKDDIDKAIAAWRTLQQNNPKCSGITNTKS